MAGSGISPGSGGRLRLDVLSALKDMSPASSYNDSYRFPNAVAAIFGVEQETAEDEDARDGTPLLILLLLLLLTLQLLSSLELLLPLMLRDPLFLLRFFLFCFLLFFVMTLLSCTRVDVIHGNGVSLFFFLSFSLSIAL